MLRKTEAEAEPAASGAGNGLLPAVNARDGPSEPLTHLMARPESVGSLPDTKL